MAADAAWRAFDALVRDPNAMAYEAFTSVKAGGGLPSPQELPGDCIALLLYLLRMDPALSAHEQVVAAEVRRRGVAEFDTARYTEPRDGVSAALDAGSAALLRNWQTGDTASPAERLAELQSADAALAALPEESLTGRRREIDTARVDLAIAAARIHADLGDVDAAAADWRRALVQARPADPTIPADHLMLKAVRQYCEWIGRADPDAALSEILPLVEQVISGPPDIERVEMLAYLSGFYLKHGDDVAGRQMANRLEGELVRLGFPDSTTGDYLDVLHSWVAAAQACAAGRNGPYRALNSGLTGWLRVHASHEQLAAGDGRHRDRMAALEALFQAMASREEAVAAIDQQWFAAAAGMPHDANAPVAPDFSAEQAAIERFRALSERADAGETTDELLALWRAAAADPALLPNSRASSALHAADILVGRQLWDAARPELEAAIALARGADEHVVEVRAWRHLIMEQVAHGDTAAASRVCGQAIDRIEEVRSRFSTPYLESALMEDLADPYILGIETARRGGDWQRMLERTELLRARELQSQASQRDSDVPLLDELRRLSAEFAGATEGEEELRFQRQAIWERLLIARQQHKPRFDLDMLQRRIAGRAVVLAYYFLAEDTLLRMCITGESVLCDKVSFGGPDFAAALDGLAQASAGSGDVQRHLSALAPELLPPDFATAVHAAEQVIVCPHQALHQVPYAALPFDGATLIELKPVGAVPNLTCLLAEPRSTESRTPYYGIATRKAIDEHGRPTASLRTVEREIKRAATLFGAPSSTLLGSQVTRHAWDSVEVRTAVESARVVHLALHGSDVADADVANAPMEAKLYLADGPVDGLDVITWTLTADVVILSACHAGKRAVSARGMARLPTDTVYGLQAAFHQAGAHALIGPLWAVADQVAPELIRPLCAALRDGRSPNAALQHAVRTYLGATVGSWRSPSLWGSFTLVGFTPAAFGLSQEAS